jgi:hypothetical protein
MCTSCEVLFDFISLLFCFSYLNGLKVSVLLMSRNQKNVKGSDFQDVEIDLFHNKVQFKSMDQDPGLCVTLIRIRIRIRIH